MPGKLLRIVIRIVKSLAYIALITSTLCFVGWTIGESNIPSCFLWCLSLTGLMLLMIARIHGTTYIYPNGHIAFFVGCCFYSSIHTRYGGCQLFYWWRKDEMRWFNAQLLYSFGWLESTSQPPIRSLLQRPHYLCRYHWGYVYEVAVCQGIYVILDGAFLGFAFLSFPLLQALSSGRC